MTDTTSKTSPIKDEQFSYPPDLPPGTTKPVQSATLFIESILDRSYQVEQLLRKARQFCAYSDDKTNQVMVLALGHVETIQSDCKARLRRLGKVEL